MSEKINNKKYNSANGAEKICDYKGNEIYFKDSNGSEEWRDYLLSLGSLTDNLLAFIREKNQFS